MLSAPPVALLHVYSLCGHWRAEDHFHVPEREKQEVLAAIVARKTERSKSPAESMIEIAQVHRLRWEAAALRKAGGSSWRSGFDPRPEPEWCS